MMAHVLKLFEIHCLTYYSITLKIGKCSHKQCVQSTQSKESKE